MAVYDLMLKLEGMKALCGDGVSDDSLNLILFPTKALEERRSALSRLKAGKLVFTEQLKSILTEDFNERIAKNVLRNPSPLGDGVGLLRNEDWERPIHEVFAHLGRGLAADAPAALGRAHAAIADALHGLREHRQQDYALLVADYDPADADLSRFPVSAAPVDPLELPPVRLRAGQPMIAALVRAVTDRPMRGWLFYIRNPDTRQGSAQSRYIWDQDLAQMVYWHEGGSFEIAPAYTGPLPGFPAVTTHLLGEVTAYLLVEPPESSAVTELLRTPDPAWDGVSTPSFEGFANLVTGRRRLFQQGNVHRQNDGRLNYPPPKLYVRRYRVED